MSAGPGAGDQMWTTEGAPSSRSSQPPTDAAPVLSASPIRRGPRSSRGPRRAEYQTKDSFGLDARNRIEAGAGAPPRRWQWCWW
jgi:hypothetical protein